MSAEFVLDLTKPTHHYEVSVWHYAGDRYSVDRDKGHGRAAVYETDNRDKALGVAEYLEQTGRASYSDAGEPVENTGEPFAGAIVHWDCGEVDHGPAPATAPARTAADRERLARETADHIVSVLIPQNDRLGKFREVSICGEAPRDAEAIARELLDGHVWVSWMDDVVNAAMRELHGDPEGPAAGFLGDYAEEPR